MTTLTWGALDKRKFETGVDRGVFYPKSGPGVVWNGLLSVNESEDDLVQTITYFDGEKVQNQISVGNFQAELSAITYPDEFEDYDGVMDSRFYEQARRAFNFSYRSRIGDAVEGVDLGYKLHLVYNAVASPSNEVHATHKDDVEISAFSWNLATSPVPFVSLRPSAHVIIDSTKVYPWALAQMEDILYGIDNMDPRFPTPTEILTLFENASILRIIDHGDGTWTAIGPDDVVSMIDATTFQIAWPSVVYDDAVTYTVSSL